MFLMHEWRGIFSIQYLRVFMALETFPLRHMAIPLENTDMALLTGHPSGNILSMIKTPAFDLNIPLRFNMAGGTTPYSTRNAFLLPSWASLVEMAGKTVGFMNGEVSSLDKLGVAGGAPKSHPPSQLAEMLSMGKIDIFKYHIPFQIIYSVTSFLKTVSIVSLIMEFFKPLSYHEVGQGKLKIYPFPLEVIEKARASVTIEAGYFIM